jgi:SAM-dependent methyltransferase
MAERWAVFYHDTPELTFYQQHIERFGQPVLDLACGTGRVLVPLLKIGIDIEGCDVSADMLHHCRKAAADAGYEPNLYNQPMDAIDLPRRYQMIYICSSFGLAGGRQKDQETLFRCYEHLNEGGALILNIEAEYAYPDAWRNWLKETRNTLPEPWSDEARVEVAPDGTEYRSWSRLVEVNPLEQSYTREVRNEKWQDGRLIAQEEQALTGFMYFKNELHLMLQIAGFDEITVYDDYTDQEAAAETSELVFVARK